MNSQVLNGTAITDTSLVDLCAFMNAASISNIPILLSAQSAGALVKAMTTSAPVQPVAVPDGVVEPTYMTVEQGRDWAWKDVKKDVGTEGWTAGDNGNYFGFFVHGWNYRGQFEKQRRAATAAQGDAKELADKVASVLEGYADNYDMMSRIGKTGDVDCKSVAHDIRRNMVDGVRAAIADKAVAP